MSSIGRHTAAALATLVLLGALGLLGTASTAQAQTPPAGACCAATTSRLDELLNPVEGGDEDFFTQPSGPPNVALIIDNSAAMRNSFPVSFCTGDAFKNDCNCPQVDALGYRAQERYEAEIQNLNSGTYYDDWFRHDRVYDIRNYSPTAPSYGDSGPGTAPVANTWPVSGAYSSSSSYGTAAGGACNGVNAGARARCQQCLATKGYFIGESHRVLNDDNVRTDWRLTGNFLNFVGPRYVMVRKVLKQVIRDIQPVRMMTVVLNEADGTSGPRVLTTFNPPCNLSDPTQNASNFYSNRQSIMSALDGSLRFRGNTPLTKSLYGAGYAFQFATSDATQHVYRQQFGASWDTSMGLTSGQVGALTEGGSNQRAVCFSCTFNAAIVLTHGQPSDAYERAVPGVVGQNQYQWADCPECQDTNLDEVAGYLWNGDLRPDLPGEQDVATYTIGFGLEPGHWSQRLLRRTAEVGGGRYYGASSSSQLRRAILDVFDDVNSRNIAFSAANVASLQVSGSAQTAVIPRMSPRRDMSWLGYLWRFGLYNEFIENNDLNGNGNLDDVFVVDADGSIVVEDTAGRFVKRESQSAATPFWEASDRLLERVGGQHGWQARSVWTVRDTAAPSGAFTSADALTRFTSVNWQQLKPYLGVAGTPACPTVNDDLSVASGLILERLGLTFQRASQLYGSSLLGLDVSGLRLAADAICHRVLIDWSLGRDLGDEDGDGDLDETRLSVLGDIFHSSPVTVDPPVDKFLCDLGLHNQCVRTLYSDDLGIPRTPHASQSLPGTCGTSVRNGADAYDRYHFDNRTREKIVLVGANDGMLHAFRDTRGQPRCDGNLELVDYAMTADSGREAWALIPPDALPRLHLQITEGHKYFVDGDVMVRDLWNDDNGDGRKQPEEFRTVAIAAMGRGGNHYFAVELLWQDSGGARVISMQPRFLWMFPQPCSEESALFGKTLYALSPKPPPVGPVLLQRCESAAPNNADGSPNTTCGVGRYDVGTEERWVAMLSGGWSPGQEKGRGVYMVDAYRGVATTGGARTDNLLWKFEYDANASGERDEPKRHLTHSVVAPVSMVDYGQNDSVRMDGFFDTGIVGDLAGQLWVFRFQRPGQVDPATGLVRNWAGARSFQQDLQGAPSVAKTWPFFLPASVGLQPENGALRAFVGTGNRYELLAQRAGSCQFDDPLACAKYGCSSQVTTAIRKHSVDVNDSSTSWSSTQSFSGARQTRTSAAALGMCGTATAEVTRHEIGCGVGSVRAPRAECRVNAAGVYTCARTDSTVMNLATVAETGSSTQMSALSNNRFYGMWVYGRAVSRMFEEDRVSSGTGWRTARQFDGARVTDRRASGAGDLVDVTATTCDAAGTCTGATAQPDGMGWFFEYRDTYTGTPDRDRSLSHKTASGASLIASCTLWNTLYPVPQTSQCGAATTSRARFHQADFLTGAPNCAFAFGGARFQEREVLAPPPEPAIAVQYSRETGQLRLSSLLVEPGRDRATTVGVSESTDLLQPVYELPISRELHDCRHSPRGCQPTVP